MSTPAGWYPDPTQAQTQRYWDGDAWTSSRAPALPAQSHTMVTLGWVFALLVPIVGLVLGILVADRHREGTWIIAVSIVSGLLWVAVFVYAGI